MNWQPMHWKADLADSRERKKAGDNLGIVGDNLGIVFSKEELIL